MLRAGYNNFTGSVPDSMSTMTRLMYVPIVVLPLSLRRVSRDRLVPGCDFTHTQGTGAGQLWTGRPGA